jgi:hypothetical protein
LSALSPFPNQETYISISKHSKIISLHIHKTQNDIFPPINKQQLEILFRAVFVDCVGGVEGCEDDVVEECLEGGDGGSFVDEEGGESVCCCYAEG